MRCHTPLHGCLLPSPPSPPPPRLRLARPGVVLPQPVRWFWEVVHSWGEPMQKRLLFFVTGCDRVPIKGLGHLNPPFVISRAGAHSDRLPSAHTCFNHMLLPDYSTRWGRGVLGRGRACGPGNAAMRGMSALTQQKGVVSTQPVGCAKPGCRVCAQTGTPCTHMHTHTHATHKRDGPRTYVPLSAHPTPAPPPGRWGCREVLKGRLELAMENAEGFGLL